MRRVIAFVIQYFHWRVYHDHGARPCSTIPNHAPDQTWHGLAMRLCLFVSVCVVLSNPTTESHLYYYIHLAVGSDIMGSPQGLAHFDFGHVYVHKRREVHGVTRRRLGWLDTENKIRAEKRQRHVRVSGEWKTTCWYSIPDSAASLLSHHAHLLLLVLLLLLK